MVENLPANVGDTGSSPGLGISHMPRSNWAREPQLLSLRVWSLCSATREATIVRGPRTVMKSGPRTMMKSGLHLTQLEKALARNEDPTQPKINIINKNLKKKRKNRASLVAQWSRICLPMQGTRVRALVWEDPTCHGATGPVSHNY